MEARREEEEEEEMEEEVVEEEEEEEEEDVERGEAERNSHGIIRRDEQIESPEGTWQEPRGRSAGVRGTRKGGRKPG